MNSKKKKIVGVIVGLLIVVIGIVALWFVAPNLYETEEPVSTAEDVFLYEEDMNPQPIGVERFMYTFEKAEGEYIWAEIDESIDYWKVYSVTRDSMESRLAGLGSTERDMRITDLDNVKKIGETIISNFGTEKEKIGNIYLGYEPSNITCLGNTKYNTDDSGQTISDEMAENGLVLSYENVSANRVLAANSEEFVKYGFYYIEVTADVTCVENSGIHKDVSWIPKEGETKNVTFVIECRMVSHMKDEVTVCDIGVIE